MGAVWESLSEHISTGGGSVGEVRLVGEESCFALTNVMGIGS